MTNKYGYGAVLIAESEDGGYQVVCDVDDEASSRDAAREYLSNGPKYGLLPPERFVVNRRNGDGFYIKDVLAI